MPNYRQQQQAQRPMNTREALNYMEKLLGRALPQYTYSQKENEKGKYLLIKETELIGLGIWYKNGEIQMEALTPSEKWNKRLGKAVMVLNVYKKKKRYAMAEKVMEVLQKVTQ